MTSLDLWQTRNNEYLTAALAWLRARLELAGQRATAAVASAEPPAPRPEASVWDFFRRSSADALPAPKEVLRLPAPGKKSANAPALEALAQQLAAASEGDPPPALVLLAQRLGLSTFERDTMLLCVAMELDTRMPVLCAQAQGEATRAFPTFALAMSLLDNAAWEALSPERPLRYWRLIEINQPGAQSLTASALRADERIVSFIKGLNYLDDRLSPLVTMVSGPELGELPESQREVATHIVESLSSAEGLRGPIALVGRDEESKRRVAAAVSRSLGLHLYRLQTDLLPAHVGELETLARLWQRESLLLPLALLIDAQDANGAAGAGTSENALLRLTRFISRSDGLLFVSTRDALPAATIDPLLAVDVEKPTAAEQQLAWSSALGPEAAGLPERLAGQFNLNQLDIAVVATGARREESSQPLAERLWEGCRARTRPTLNRLAEKLDAKATWEHLVLPPQETALLQQIECHVGARAKVYDEWGFRARMNRGLGINALFAGDSGTGKTMAAEVLANALHLDLYRIDLSAVVSKYIGETEKNLRQVFDSAEDGGAILLFDEADALFGKRSEVKDSHDRYANIEINYLLQRMEAYRGLAILATNMKSALDTAFTRRLRFIINFPFPAIPERRQMWERAFPSGTPLGVIDYERLSKFNLTGGTIHNIALNAAFMAVQAGTPVTMGLLLQAGRVEFRKLDRPVNEADFRWVEPTEARA